MLSTYRAVFRAPGSAAFATAGFIMRMPIAMFPIGLVLIISARTGHYQFAGVLSAVYVLGGVPGNPLLARVVDRFGQSRILVPASAVTIAAALTLAGLLIGHVPDWVLTIPTFVAGFSYLSVGSLIRARWSMVHAGRPELSTAYSLESVLDEVIFVLGPLVTTLIATTLDPVITLYVISALIGVGALWLSTLRATEPAAREEGAPPHPSAIRAPGMTLVCLAGVGMGATFAGAEISMVAFCGQHGHRGLSGLALAMFAFGSVVSGLFYGARTFRTGVLHRFATQASVFAVLPVLFLAAINVPTLLVCSFVVGLGIAPTLITGFGLIQDIVPSAALTEGLAWLLTGLNIGYGLGSSLVGGLADAHGARIAFSVAICAGVFTGAVAHLLRRRLRASTDLGQTAVGASKHAALP
jgi:MFS family permease